MLIMIHRENIPQNAFTHIGYNSCVIHLAALVDK
jgi:hypothetical protein